MQQLPLKVSPDSSSEFDIWFEEDRGSGIDYEIEGDVNECIEDDYSEQDQE